MVAMVEFVLVTVVTAVTALVFVRLNILCQCINNNNNTVVSQDPALASINTGNYSDIFIIVTSTS